MGLLINDNRLNEIIKSVILEYSGVSDDVLSISKRIRDKALEFLNGNEYDSIVKWKEECLDFGINQMFPGGDINQMPLTDVDINKYRKSFWVSGIEDLEHMISHVNIHAYGYNMLDVERENYVVGFLTSHIQSNGKYYGYYNPKGRYIVLTIPCGIDPRNGSVHIGSTSLSFINHEVKHAYQHYKGGCGLTRDEIYNISNTHGDVESESKVIDKLGLSIDSIKYAYYMFSLGELDAFLQQIYLELTEKGCMLEQSWSYLNVKSARDIYSRIYEFYTTRKYSYAIRFIFKKIYGADVLDRYISHCQKGIKYFDEHLRRIIGRVNSEHPEQKLF